MVPKIQHEMIPAVQSTKHGPLTSSAPSLAFALVPPNPVAWPRPAGGQRVGHKGTALTIEGPLLSLQEPGEMLTASSAVTARCARGRSVTERWC